MKDSWLLSAMEDDTLVADLLLRLKDSDTPPIPSVSAAPALTWPAWGNRRRRSRTAAPDMKEAAMRRSPTTPLSFGDGYDESSSVPSVTDQISAVRSVKSCPTNETSIPCTTTTTTTTAAATSRKRSTREKTFSELKEEEKSLWKEQTFLKKEWATLQLTLKRMRLDLPVECGAKPEASSYKTDERITCDKDEPADAPRLVKQEHTLEPYRLTQNDVVTKKTIFVLPDLNMMPEEEC